MNNDKRYRIGRGEQGVLLVRLYTDDVVNTGDLKRWRCNYIINKILFMYHSYKDKDFVGIYMCRKFRDGFVEREDVITKMVRNTKTVKYYSHKRKTLTESNFSSYL